MTATEIDMEKLHQEDVEFWKKIKKQCKKQLKENEKYRRRDPQGEIWKTRRKNLNKVKKSAKKAIKNLKNAEKDRIGQ